MFFPLYVKKKKNRLERCHYIADILSIVIFAKCFFALNKHHTRANIKSAITFAIINEEAQ